MRPLSILVVLVLVPPVSAQQAEPKYEDHPFNYWLDKVTHAEDKSKRKSALEAVKAFPDGVTRAAPVLVAKLGDLSEDYRIRMMEAFIELEPGAKAKAVVPELIKRLETSPPRESVLLIRMLCAIGPDAKSAIAVIQRVVMKDIGPSKAVEETKYDGLSDELLKLGPVIVPLLIEMLKTPEKEVIVHTLWQLIELGPAAKAAAPAVAKYLQETDPHLRIQAAHTLGVIANSPEAKAMLLEDLKNVDVDIRLSAARALRDIGRPQAAVDVLIDFVRKNRTITKQTDYKRIEFALAILSQYGSAAKSILPDLKAFGDQKPPKKGTIEETTFQILKGPIFFAIDRIENDKK